jgi:hypothetical protein
MKNLIKLALSVLVKDGKWSSLIGLSISGLAHNFLPKDTPPEVFAVIDAVAGKLLLSADPKKTEPTI